MKSIRILTFFSILFMSLNSFGNLSLKGQFIQQINTDGTRIFITRETGDLVGSAMGMVVELNGINYAKLVDKQTAVLEIYDQQNELCIKSDLMQKGRKIGCEQITLNINEKKFFIIKWKPGIRQKVNIIEINKEQFLTGDYTSRAFSN